MPRDLHPTLSAGPEPKRICAGCRATDDTAVLVPIPHQTTTFICGTCALVAQLDAMREMTRQACMLLFDAVAPEVPAEAS